MKQIKPRVRIIGLRSVLKGVKIVLNAFKESEFCMGGYNKGYRFGYSFFNRIRVLTNFKVILQSKRLEF